jgi:hypothetical protein
MDVSARFDPTHPFPLSSQLPHDSGMQRDEAFHDSDFDWDALTARLPMRTAERPQREMNRLAWIVLLLLVFCPPLGYVLATLWH